ncbi:MAG: metallophosphoesterase family protein [bacterium]
MRIAFLSDLHLGPGVLNRCVVDRKTITRWLDLIESTHDRVIVVGDLYDLSRPRQFGGWQRHLDSLRFEWGEVLERLEAMEAVYGNHDRARGLMGVPERIEIDADGMKMLVLHGHQFDPHINKVPGLESVANFAAGWFTRLGVEPLGSLMGDVVAVNERLESRIGTQPAYDLSTQGAMSLHADGYRVVVMGHSHQLRHLELPAGQFINTGSWTARGAQWVSVETQSGSVHLFEDGACLNPV